MKGLIIKEFINLRKYGRTMFVVLAFYIVFGLIMKNTIFINGMIVLMFSMLAITTFSYDKQGRWDIYALSLPLKRRTIVMSKYAIAVLMALFGI